MQVGTWAFIVEQLASPWLEGLDRNHAAEVTLGDQDGARFADFDDALTQVNDSVFGLQAGIFTRDINKIQRAWDRLEVGGVLIGDVPSWRVDNMPYGGVKESGLGREGIRYAMEDMTEIRLLVIRTPGDLS